MSVKHRIVLWEIRGISWKNSETSIQRALGNDGLHTTYVSQSVLMIGLEHSSKCNFGRRMRRSLVQNLRLKVSDESMRLHIDHNPELWKSIVNHLPHNNELVIDSNPNTATACLSVCLLSVCLCEALCDSNVACV